MTHVRHPAVSRDDWPHGTGRHSFCPRCGSPDARLRQVLQAAQLGTFSLAGMQMKVTARWAWEYRCFECGDTGPCEIREPVTARLAREGRSG